MLVGMFWSDGWVVPLDGHPTCFIAVELLAQSTPARAAILLAHEAAHVAHAACLGEGWGRLETLGHELFVEGLATVASARIVPGDAAATDLWAGLDRTPRGLRTAAWSARCEASWPLLRAQLRRELDSTDPERIASYVLGSKAPPDRLERVGYFAGFRLVDDLARAHTIAELGRWSAERIQDEIGRALERADRCPPVPST